jgi:hypothetical protein
LSTDNLLSKDSPLLRTRSLAGVFPIEEALGVFDALAVADERNDRRRSLLRKAAIACGVLTGIVLFAGIPIAAVATGPAVIVLLVLAYRLGRVDIPNDVRLFVLPWLRILSADMAAAGTVELKLDLHESTDACHRQDDDFTGGRRWEVYHHPWFSGQATLADGARLAWNAVAHIRRYTRRKSKGRTKTKIKQAMKYDVSLGLPADSFAVAPVAGKGLEKVKVKPGEKRNVVRVSYVAHSAALAPANLDDLIHTVASAYGRGTPKPATEQPA